MKVCMSAAGLGNQYTCMLVGAPRFPKEPRGQRERERAKGFATTRTRAGEKKSERKLRDCEDESGREIESRERGHRCAWQLASPSKPFHCVADHAR